MSFRVLDEFFKCHEISEKGSIVLGEIGAFSGVLLQMLWALLPRFLLALFMTGALLVLFFSRVKERVRRHVTHWDSHLRELAGRMRYRTPGDEASDRVKWTWFFRFWTNFASAPSLSFWSLFVPFWMWQRALSTAPNAQTTLASTSHWVLPGVCYAGSMLLSFVLKRVFKRVRPPREGQAFGYKLKDPSFPSGHSLTSFCFWLMLAVVVSTTGTMSFLGALLFSLFALSIPLLTGWSRIYLGVHFPSDVAGGYCIGMAWCVACFLAFPFLLV